MSSPRPNALSTGADTATTVGTMHGARGGDESTAKLVGGLAGAGVAGLLAWFHVGPFRWICELEAAALGGRYHPALAFLLTTLLFALPLSLVLHSLWGDGAGAWSRWFSAWARIHPRNFQLSFLGIFGSLAGLFMLVRSFSYGSHVETTLAEIEANGPPSCDVTLRDFALDLDWSVEEGPSRIYVPLFTEADRPTRVLLEGSPPQIERAASAGEVDGLLRAADLPNDVRLAYEDRGRLADEYWVLHAEETPSDDRDFGTFGLLGGLAVLAAAGFFYFARARHTLSGLL